MLSNFEVRFGALIFWDTFRRGAAGRYWSARGMISFSFQLVTGQINFVQSLARSVQTPNITDTQDYTIDDYFQATIALSSFAEELCL